VDAKNNAIGNFTLSINCGGASNSCDNTISLSCGSTYNGNNSTGGKDWSMYKLNNSVSGGLTGPEMIHTLTVASSSVVTINLTGLSADLDLFVLSSCNATKGIGFSERTGTQSEQVVLTLAAGTYKIVVDGYNNAISNYSLNVQCQTYSACTPPSLNQLYAENITKTSAQLVCSVQAVGYNWRYRALGTTTWWSIGSQGNKLSLLGLIPGTTYEYQCALRCVNGSLGEWSGTKTFTTLSDATLSNTCANPTTLQCAVAYDGNTGSNHANSYTSYQIGNTVHSGMTGAEAVHKFTVTGNSAVTLHLSGLTADLDMYLMSYCDPAFGIAVSENQGTAIEQIAVNNLAPGTYYVIVDGYNGATSPYKLLLTCGNAGNGNAQLYDNACDAGNLSVGTNCTPQLATNVGATASATPAAPANSADCNTTNIKDVWFRAQIPNTNKLNIILDPGTLTNAVVSIYTGANCNALTFIGCVDDENGGDQMPDLTISGSADTWVWLRISGYNGATGTFYICANKVEATNLRPGDNSGVQDRGLGDNDNVVFDLTAATALKVFPVPATDFVTIATELTTDASVDLIVTDLNGRIIRTITAIEATAGTFSQQLDIQNLPNGNYVVRLKAGATVLTGRFVKVD
jgi:hypothetical protein